MFCSVYMEKYMSYMEIQTRNRIGDCHKSCILIAHYIFMHLHKSGKYTIQTCMLPWSHDLPRINIWSTLRTHQWRATNKYRWSTLQTHHRHVPNQSMINAIKEESSGAKQSCWQYYFLIIMTSSNRNRFRVSGPLCGEITDHWWIPRTKASDTEL